MTVDWKNLPKPLLTLLIIFVVLFVVLPAIDKGCHRLNQRHKIEAMARKNMAIAEEAFFSHLQDEFAKERDIRKSSITNLHSTYEIDLDGGGIRDFWRQRLGPIVVTKSEELLVYTVGMCGQRLGRVSRISVGYHDSDSFGNRADYVVELKPDAELVAAVHDKTALTQAVRTKKRIVTDTATDKVWRTTSRRK